MSPTGFFLVISIVAQALMTELRAEFDERVAAEAAAKAEAAAAAAAAAEAGASGKGEEGVVLWL